ncbi:hypothetical protein HGM15179_019290, partial [Zosterops borbonicus]
NIWTLPVSPELTNLEEAEEDPELLIDNQSWLDRGSEHELEDTQVGPKRWARQLTEEDLPVSNYCHCANCYCWCVCEPLLGYYPYPYCYQGRRVICHIIMPCNWWIVRMLDRV